VFVVGAGNSAGQAALHLARFADDVTILVRGQTLGASLSDYLVREIETAPNITIRYGIEVTGATGGAWLESIDLRDRASGETEHAAASALFALIGAQPQAGWIPDGVTRDAWGFISTGAEVPPSPDRARDQLPLETSMRGVFAVGDIRRSSIKRVASAVGEGSISIQYVLRHLDEIRGREVIDR
jgi:thioredoxin reductase (NADPH)